jgi:hypothetical protein
MKEEVARLITFQREFVFSSTLKIESLFAEEASHMERRCPSMHQQYHDPRLRLKYVLRYSA